MSEHNAQSRGNAGGCDSARRVYEKPAAQWHDLKVITLGGATGLDDSGSPETQQANRDRGYDGDRSGGNP